MTRSGTVLGPMPMAIVNRPTNVPSKANPWTANATPRTARGRIQVASRPPRRTDAITLSATAAAPCAYPGRRTPKCNAAADRNVAAWTIMKRESVRPPIGTPRADSPAPSMPPSGRPHDGTVLDSSETPGAAPSHEHIRGPQRTRGDLLPLVRGLALLGAQEDCRIGVGPQTRLALLQAFVFQVARPVPAEPRFLVEDEAAGADAHEIRREDAFQERDVAAQFGFAQVFRKFEHVRFRPGAGLDPGWFVRHRLITDPP